MARTADRGAAPAPGGATLDFERQLWAMADGLRGHPALPPSFALAPWP